MYNNKVSEISEVPKLLDRSLDGQYTPLGRSNLPQQCVNLATDALGLSHDGLSRHRAGLPAHLGAAVNKD